MPPKLGAIHAAIRPWTQSSEDTAWLAGLLEGEGSFRCQKTKRANNAFHIKLELMDRDVVERAAKLMGGCCQRRFRNRPTHSFETFEVDLTNWRAEAVAMAILPLMGMRRSYQIMSALADFLKAHQPRGIPE